MAALELFDRSADIAAELELHAVGDVDALERGGAVAARLARYGSTATAAAVLWRRAVSRATEGSAVHAAALLAAFGIAR